MMIQAMWSADLTWDERLPDELAKPALTWFKEIPDLAKIKVPRCLKELELVADSQLHVFTDASQEAYGGVAYQSGTVTSRLVMSKAKVTPLKAISVPRIELMAAIIGLQISETASQNRRRRGSFGLTVLMFFIGCVVAQDSSNRLSRTELGRYRPKLILLSGSIYQLKPTQPTS